MTGLPAGAYREIAREFVEDGKWEDRSFLEAERAAAISFAIAEGGTESVSLKLPPSR